MLANRTIRLAAVLLGCTGAATAQAVEAEDLGACARVAEDTARLACYDRLARRAVPAASIQSALPPATEPPVARFDDPATDAAATTSPMQARWELTADTDRGTFGLRPHQQNYIVVKDTNRVNDRPFRPLLDQAPNPDQGLESTEVKFQLSFKIKLLDNLGTTGSNLWFGYTQQSNWQMFNGGISRPFRETNYEPEVMWVTPLSYKLGGLQLRYAGLGFVHQSNGRAEPLSRSWNRVYAEAGAEYGNLALWIRPWWRVPESKSRDDNPDIVDYIGRGELVGVYRRGQHQYSLKLRSTFKNSRGSAEVDWSFPVAGQLRGYVRLFSGYGESMIDYNWRQTTLGIGVILTDRL